MLKYTTKFSLKPRAIWVILFSSIGQYRNNFLFSSNHLEKTLWNYGTESVSNSTSIKYNLERDEQYLPYIELGPWLCSHIQLETPLNFHKQITQKLYNLEK